MDVTQICINSRYVHDNKPIKFGDLDLIFMGHISKNAKFRAKIIKCTFSSDWVN